MTIDKAGRILYFVDQKRNLHCTMIFVMKEKVNPIILNEALNDVLKIFTLVNKDLLLKDEVLYFVDNDRTVKVVNEKDGILFGSDKINGHHFYVSYYENNIRISISHAITDGGGLSEFSKALILNYLERLTNKKLDVSFIRRVSDGSYEDDLTDFYDLDYSNVEVNEAKGYEKECFILPETKQKGAYTVANLFVNESELLQFAKKYETSVATLAFYLFAKATYRLNKEAKGNNILVRITADVRKALGIPHSQLNCSLAAHLSLNEEDVKDENISVTLKRMKQILKSQLQEDVIKYEASVLAKTGMYKADLHPTISISYMGKMDLGEMSQYVDDLKLIEGEFHKINFFSYNGQFKLSFHLGNGSERYAKEIENILKEYGIDSRVSELEILKEEKQ